MATAGVLTALGGLATVWLLAAPADRQAETRASTATVAMGGAGASLATTKVRFRWDPSAEEDLAGYVVSWGDAPSKYTETRAVGAGVTSIELEMAPRPQPYFIAVQARNRAGQLGGYSNEFRLDLSSGTPRAEKASKSKASRASSSRTKGSKPRLTKEEKAQRRLEKQERKKKAREAAKQKQPVP